MRRRSIRGRVRSRGALLVLLVGLWGPGGCSKDDPRPGGAATGARGSGAGSTGARRAPPRRGATALPGAPTDRPLLAFPSAQPSKLDWPEHGVWRAGWRGPWLGRFALPAVVAGAAARIVAEGWSGKDAPAVARFLDQQRAALAAGLKIPPCRRLREGFGDVVLVRRLALAQPLEAYLTALLLAARRAEQRGLPERAARLVVAALRLGCHLSHVPDVLMKVKALVAERQTLHLLGILAGEARACPRLLRAVGAHRKARAPIDELDVVQWLAVRADLRFITRGLAVSGSAQQLDQRRLARLEAEIVEQASALYGQFWRRVRRAMTTDAPADWTALDQWIAGLEREMAGLKRTHGVASGADLVKLLARYPKKPPAWTARIVARVFVSFSTLRAHYWQSARQVDRENATRLGRLGTTRCP